jgi:glycine/D-amino acid oxidase-like deaminating enzyme
MKTASVVVCGAGITGVSAAFHLAVRQGLKEVLLVDELAPLTLDQRQVYRGLPQLVAWAGR